MLCPSTGSCLLASMGAQPAARTSPGTPLDPRETPVHGGDKGADPMGASLPHTKERQLSPLAVWRRSSVINAAGVTIS